MEIKEAINELKELRNWMNGSRDLYMSIDVAKEAIDTVVAEVEKPLSKRFASELFYAYQEGFNAATDVLIGANKVVHERRKK